MKTSQASVNKLKVLEGFRSTAYKDGQSSGKQMYSIGYGHQIQPNETHLRSGTISTAEGEKILRSDLAAVESVINKTLKAKYNQNQFDALALFGYNTGVGSLAKVIATWNTTKDAKQAAANMALYTKTHNNTTGQLEKSSTLEKRRVEEISLFQKPYTGGVIAGVAILAGAFALTRFLS